MSPLDPFLVISAALIDEGRIDCAIEREQPRPKSRLDGSSVVIARMGSISNARPDAD
jgi:hypothetical protein